MLVKLPENWHKGMATKLPPKNEQPSGLQQLERLPWFQVKCSVLFCDDNYNRPQTNGSEKSRKASEKVDYALDSFFHPANYLIKPGIPTKADDKLDKKKVR